MEILIGYLLGCLATIVALVIVSLIEYKLENEFQLTVGELMACIIVTLLSWVGFVVVLCLFLYWINDSYKDKVIFKK